MVVLCCTLDFEGDLLHFRNKSRREGRTDFNPRVETFALCLLKVFLHRENDLVCAWGPYSCEFRAGQEIETSTVGVGDSVVI